MTTKTKRPSKWSMNHARNKVTVRVEFTDGLVMLFGTSYRKWWDQLHEFLGWQKNRGNPIGVRFLDVSREPWIGYGGLKWCAPESLQAELDKEGKGRTTEVFKFEPASDWDWDRFRGDEFA